MMVLVMSNEGHTINPPPHTHTHDLWVNATAYIEALDTVARSWINEVAQWRPYMCHHDSVPSHTVGKTDEWLTEHFLDYVTPKIWSSSSLDLNPMNV